MRPPFLASFILLSLILQFDGLHAQNNRARDYIEVRGYIKNMGSVTFVDNIKSVSSASLLHNRINLKVKPFKQLIIAAELRTRLIINEQQRLIPNFADQIGRDNGLLDLSFTWVNQYPVLFNTAIDRLYVDWKNDKWNIRLGRQRLNWGINLSWNPNDIFNVYNIFDFDYEERPGVDAVKVQYNLGPFSNIELAFAPSRDKYKMTGAIKYVFNTHNYDLQFIAGNYQRDVVLGVGFAGNIKDAGFKGEASYFQDWNDKEFKTAALSVSASIDYSFKKGWYINGSFLYSNKAKDQFTSTGILSVESITPKTLMPAKFNFMIQAAKQLTPVLTGNLLVIYSPKLNLLVISPSISYSIATDWDLDVVIQDFFSNNLNNKFTVQTNLINLRLKWSFSK